MKWKEENKNQQRNEKHERPNINKRRKYTKDVTAAQIVK